VVQSRPRAKAMGYNSVGAIHESPLQGADSEQQGAEVAVFRQMVCQCELACRHDSGEVECPPGNPPWPLEWALASQPMALARGGPVLCEASHVRASRPDADLPFSPGASLRGKMRSYL